MLVARIGPFRPGEVRFVGTELAAVALTVITEKPAPYTYRLDVVYDPQAISIGELMDLAEKASSEWESE